MASAQYNKYMETYSVKNKYMEIYGAMKIADDIIDPVIGTYCGRPVRQSELLFNTKKKAYEISIDGAIVEIRPQDLLPKSIRASGESDKVACADIDLLGSTPITNVYCHDRYPSITVSHIVDDAIELLRTKKRLSMSLQYLRQEKTDWRLCVELTYPDESSKLIECTFDKKAFDRHEASIDKYAGLKAKLDTNTFLKLRIAYLLFQAQKLRMDDAISLRYASDIFRITHITQRR